MTYRKTYLVLLVLSVLLAFFPSTHLSVLEILRFESDPLLITVFNALGILPALFFIERLSRLNPFGLKEKWSYGLSFALGAFALLWGLDDQLMRIKTKRNRILHALLVVGLVGLLAYGLIFGNLESYLLVWQKDLFVRIMTLDFIVLVSLWVKRWWTLLSAPK